MTMQTIHCPVAGLAPRPGDADRQASIRRFSDRTGGRQGLSVHSRPSRFSLGVLTNGMRGGVVSYGDGWQALEAGGRAVTVGPSTRGRRCRLDGRYGKPGHRRQLYRCEPANGDRSHRFMFITIG
jgi:hypothetical protein